MIKTLALPALHNYLQQQGLCGAEPVSVTRLTGGQSNPTYRVHCGAQQFILRMRPSGPLLPSAHAIDREYRIMKALQDSAVPVPKMLAYCDDSSVLGAAFYVMEFLDGRVLLDQTLPGMSSTERGAIYTEMNRVLAALHGVDYQAIGLESFGKPGNYFGRQIQRWSRQMTEATLPISSSMRQLMEWLPEHIPADEESSIVHGDYRLDNLIFHPTQARVIGVIDWELSTLGHPLADLSYQCMSWHIPPALWRGIGGVNLAEIGLPTEAEYMQQYADATGRSEIAHWDFYMAYNLFRMAGILHGIGQRAQAGNAAAADAVAVGAKAGPLADIGWQCAQRYAAATA
jgi:acyl-CoA dehydrogenase